MFKIFNRKKRYEYSGCQVADIIKSELNSKPDILAEGRCNSALSIWDYPIPSGYCTKLVTEERKAAMRKYPTITTDRCVFCNPNKNGPKPYCMFAGDCDKREPIDLADLNAYKAEMDKYALEKFGPRPEHKSIKSADPAFSSQIFELLKLKPDQQFREKGSQYGDIYKLDSNLNLWRKHNNENWVIASDVLPLLLRGEVDIDRIIELTAQDKAVVTYARYCSCRYVAMDNRGRYYMFTNKPNKVDGKWVAVNNDRFRLYAAVSFVSSEDEEPFDLMSLEEWNNAY